MDELDVAPIEIAFDRRGGIGTAFTREIAEWQWRAEMIPAIRFAIAGYDCVDRQDDRAIARYFGAFENLAGFPRIGSK